MKMYNTKINILEQAKNTFEQLYGVLLNLFWNFALYPQYN